MSYQNLFNLTFFFSNILLFYIIYTRRQVCYDFFQYVFIEYRRLRFLSQKNITPLCVYIELIGYTEQIPLPLSRS